MAKHKFHLRLARSIQTSQLFLNDERMPDVVSAHIGVDAKGQFPVLKVEILIKPTNFSFEHVDSKIVLPADDDIVASPEIQEK